MKTRMFCFLSVFIALSSSLRAQWSGESPWPDQLQAFIVTVIHSHPSVEAALADKYSAESRRIQVRSWEPPFIGLDLYQMPGRWLPDLRRNRETDFFIQQMIPWPGKIAAMEAVVGSEIEMKEAVRQQRIQRLIKQIKTLYVDLYVAREQRKLNRQQQDLLERYLQFLTSPSANPRVREVMMVRTDLSMARIEELRFVRMLEQSLSALHGLIGSVPDTLMFDADPVIRDIPGDPSYWMQIAREHNPSLRFMQNEAMMYRRESESERRALYPDVMVRAMYKRMHPSSGHAWSLMAGVSLPVAIWYKKGAEARITEKKRQQQKAESELEAMIREIQIEIQLAAQALKKNHQSYRQYQTLIRELQSAIDLASAATLSDPMAIADRFQFERQWIRIRTEAVMMEAEILRSIAELEWLTGKPTEQWNTPADSSLQQ